MNREPEARLWHAILAHALHDAATGKDMAYLDSPDFRMVCNLAGLDPQAVAERFDPERFRRLIKAA
ncbi:MAG: hypothetical protein LC676_19925 [Loktanella sp.]|nr:hypothetical protein [Loktanella sp.]